MQGFEEQQAPQTGSEMIEATATVVAVEDGYAVLETQRTGACSSCSASGACGTSALGEVLGRKRSFLRIENTFDAVPGEQVILGLSESDLMLASLAAYMLPIVLMIGAALAAVGFGLSDAATAFVALTGFGAGLLAARHLTRNARERFTPHFLRRAPYSFAAGSCQR